MGYLETKEKARQEAVEWQPGFADHNYSYGELFVFQNYSERLAHRFGLMKEFRENGII